MFLYAIVNIVSLFRNCIAIIPKKSHEKCGLKNIYNKINILDCSCSAKVG